ncbi:POC1 centriolar protein homolog A-like isoform X2 [Daphnia carinata]|uniref:POC1 centriolar protein homolog A-like isoform X2 n=1 Tax=Daphnia carinata TaxID=120202 RepID=UPI002868B325|nr:POC1 centriolar protein homolog A-like isoform X2 [Daphnia carinata]
MFSVERNLRGHHGTITSLAFSPNMKQLISCSNDKSIILWGLQQKMKAFRFTGHTSSVSDVCFAPSGNLMASCSQDGSLAVWIPSITGESTFWKGHQAAARSVAFTPDGRQILSASDDKTIKLWTVHKSKFVASFSSHTNWVRCTRPSPDGNQMVSCADDRTIKLWDLKSGDCIHTFYEPKAQGNYVEFHPSGTCIGTALANGVVKIYETRMRKVLQLYEIHNGPVHSLSFHPTSGNYLITGSQEGTLKVLDLMEGRPSYTLYGPKGAVHSVKFSPDGDYFATGGADNEILVWKANFAPVLDVADNSSNKSSTKTKIRPSIAGGLQGVDVKKIVASSVAEDRQDIEDASVNSKRSSSIDELEISKKTMDMQISDSLEKTGNEREKRLEIIIADLVSQVDVLTNTLLALEQRVTFIEDQQKENLGTGIFSNGEQVGAPL